MALTSCGTLGTGEKNNPSVGITDTKIITRTETLPGETITVSITPPDSKVTEDCGELTDVYIPDGSDIDGTNAVRTAVAWGRTANNCRDKNLLLKGWISGVVSALGNKNAN